MMSKVISDVGIGWRPDAGAAGCLGPGDPSAGGTASEDGAGASASSRVSAFDPEPVGVGCRDRCRASRASCSPSRRSGRP